MKGAYSNDYNADFAITKEPLIAELRKDVGKIIEQNQVDLGGSLGRFLNKFVDYL